MEERIKGTNTINIENLEHLKKGDGVQVGDTKYEYGASLSTDGVPLIDPGEGKPITIRTFVYKINHQWARMLKRATSQEIFNQHAREIGRFLWGDGLVPLDTNPPRVIINSKKGFYQIFVPCEAKRGTLFVDKPKNLSQELAKEQARNAQTK